MQTENKPPVTLSGITDDLLDRLLQLEAAESKPAMLVLMRWPLAKKWIFLHGRSTHIIYSTYMLKLGEIMQHCILEFMTPSLSAAHGATGMFAIEIWWYSSTALTWMYLLQANRINIEIFSSNPNVSSTIPFWLWFYPSWLCQKCIQVTVSWESWNKIST
jgi:hypothetical protein